MTADVKEEMLSPVVDSPTIQIHSDPARGALALLSTVVFGATMMSVAPIIPTFNVGQGLAQTIERPLVSFSGENSSITERFETLATQWRSEAAVSSLPNFSASPAYQQIIGLGAGALPLILRELAINGGHWFWALFAITGQDPAASATNIASAREAWLQWGRDHGLLDIDL